MPEVGYTSSPSSSPQSLQGYEGEDENGGPSPPSSAVFNDYDDYGDDVHLDPVCGAQFAPSDCLQGQLTAPGDEWDEQKEDAGFNVDAAPSQLLKVKLEQDEGNEDYASGYVFGEAVKNQDEAQPAIEFASVKDEPDASEADNSSPSSESSRSEAGSDSDYMPEGLFSNTQAASSTTRQPPPPPSLTRKCRDYSDDDSDDERLVGYMGGKRLKMSEPYEVTPTPFPGTAKKWTPWDDYVITVMKEGYNYGWRKMAQFIKNRHSWQGIQMHYLRTLKKRNYNLTHEEAKRFQEMIEKDWSNRFQRLAHEMGPEFTPRRLVRHCFRAVGFGHLLGPSTEEKLQYMFDSHKKDNPPKNEHDLVHMEDPAALSQSAIQFLHDYEMVDADQLIQLYLCPAKV